MGGRMGVTYQDVIEVIPKLQELRKNLTVDNVRDLLGTGSKTTIARLLREWKAQQGLPTEDDGRLPIELNEAVKALWDNMQRKADALVISERQTFEAKTNEIEQQLRQAYQLQREQQQKIHTLEEQLQQQQEENKQLKASLQIEQHEKIKSSERITALETRRQESINENERLHQLLKHVQANLEHYQAASQQLRQEQSLLLDKQQQEYEQKIAQSQIQVQTLAQEKTLCQTQLEQLKKSLEALEFQQKTLLSQYHEAHAHSEVNKITQEKMQAEHQKMQQQYQQQKQNLDNQQHQVIELQLTLKAKDQKLAELEKTLAQASDKIETLRHDYHFVSQEKATLAGQLKQFLHNQNNK